MDERGTQRGDEKRDETSQPPRQIHQSEAKFAKHAHNEKVKEEMLWADEKS